MGAYIIWKNNILGNGLDSNYSGNITIYVYYIMHREQPKLILISAYFCFGNLTYIPFLKCNVVFIALWTRRYTEDEMPIGLLMSVLIPRLRYVCKCKNYSNP